MNQIHPRIHLQLQSPSGVTLIEVLLVTAIISILATVVLTAVNPQARINEAADTQIRSDLAQLRNALEAYASANKGVYPSTGGDLWCENCTAFTARGQDQWIPELVQKGYIKRLPTSPRNGVGNGMPNCNASNAAYVYQSVPAQPGFKLWAYCTPMSGLNIGHNDPPSPYCTITSGDWSTGAYDDSGLVLTPGGNPAHTLKPMVDPKRYSSSLAVYSKNYTCL